MDRWLDGMDYFWASSFLPMAGLQWNSLWIVSTKPISAHRLKATGVAGLDFKTKGKVWGRNACIPLARKHHLCAISFWRNYVFFYLPVGLIVASISEGQVHVTLSIFLFSCGHKTLDKFIDMRTQTPKLLPPDTNPSNISTDCLGVLHLLYNSCRMIFVAWISL